MKNFTIAFCLAFICLNLNIVFAQSRRTAPLTDTSNIEKANKRPANPVASPSPQTETSDTSETQTNKTANEENAEVDDEILKISTEVVSVPVKIADKKGRFIAGLTKDSFKVYEDGIEQEIAYFSNEQQPFTVALVLDMSYSTTFKITEIQNAAMAFVSQLRANDKIMVVVFDEEVRVLCEATSDKQVLQRAIKSTSIGSGTSLYEAVDLVINQKFRKINGRKAIVLFTDGVDTTSRKAHDLSNINDALETDAIVYPIQYDTFAQVQAMKDKPVITAPTQPSPIPGKNKSPFPFPIPTSGIGTPGGQGTTPEDYRKAGEYLENMANRTGGRVYQANTTDNLAVAFSNIAAELREFYSIGYTPKEEAQAGKKHKVKVRVNQKDWVVRQSRDSYTVAKKDVKK